MPFALRNSDGNLLLLLRFNVSAISWWKKRERKVWMGRYSFMFSALYTHTKKTHTHAYTLLAPLQWNQCSQFSSVCEASGGAKGSLWSNATSSSVTSDTNASTARLLCSGASLRSHCVERKQRRPFFCRDILIMRFSRAGKSCVFFSLCCLHLGKLWR